MSLSIYLNGEEKSFDANSMSSIKDLLQTMHVKEDRVAIEVNGAIVRRSVWSETKLASGDRVELVHFVGGGSMRSETSL